MFVAISPAAISRMQPLFSKVRRTVISQQTQTVIADRACLEVALSVRRPGYASKGRARGAQGVGRLQTWTARRKNPHTDALHGRNAHGSMTLVRSHTDYHGLLRNTVTRYTVHTDARMDGSPTLPTGCIWNWATQSLTTEVARPLAL